KAYLTKEQALAAFKTLVKEGYAIDESGRATLTKSGADTARTRFGHLASGDEGRKRLERVIWPALTLGINPASKAAGRLALGENLRAAALTVGLGLPLDKETATLNIAVSTLLVRGLSGASALPHPDDILKALARSLGDLSDPDALRKGLALAGLALSNKLHPGKNKGEEDDLNAFAQRVQAVANSLATPPSSRPG